MVDIQEGVPDTGPLDAIPTPLRLHADPRFTGKGVTLALVDAAFYPHPDLVQPTNRIRAWADVTHGKIRSAVFRTDETPQWPGWDDGAPAQWHGLMTSAAAAGNGWLSQGRYRGLASDADLVLVQARDTRGNITNANIVRALKWLAQEGPALGVRVVNLSVGGDPVRTLKDNPVDEAVADLVALGMNVVVAAGNDGVRRLIPPATAPLALTIGGLDDRNMFDPSHVELWHSNYGDTAGGAHKPELVAPSIWVAAPLLPNTDLAAQALALFAQRAQGYTDVDDAIAAAKLVTPFYQHVDGTSFAAPLVASAVACMLEANPALTPSLVRDVLIATARPVEGASDERQGAGALDAGMVVAMALREHHGPLASNIVSPQVTQHGIVFMLHDHSTEGVEVVGSWNNWRTPALRARRIEPGVWQASMSRLAPGVYNYKYLLGTGIWRDDPANPNRATDGYGNHNSVLTVP